MIAPPEPALQTEPHQQELDRLTALFVNGKYPEAISLAQTLTQDFPHHGMAWKALGALYGLMGQAQEALAAMQTAVGLLPADAEAHYNLGLAWRDLGQKEPATHHFAHAIQLQPDYSDACQSLAGILDQLGRYDEAVTYYRQLLQLKPGHPLTHFKLGISLIKQGRLEEAGACYQTLLQHHPQSAEGHNNLGTVFKEMGRLDDARTCYRQALMINPDYAEASHHLGIVLSQSGRLEESINHFLHALACQPQYGEARLNLAHTLVGLGRLAEAEEHYRHTLIIIPDCAEAHLHLAKLLAKAEKQEEAKQHFQHSLRIKPNDADSHFHLGTLLVKSRKIVEALPHCRLACQLAPDVAETQLLLGVAMTEMRNLEEAEICYRRAIALKPELVEASWNLGLLLLTQGRYQEGWVFHESRYDSRLHVPITLLPAIPYRKWNGESLAGQSFLLWIEQGYGDCIQFARYAALLKQCGVTHLTVACPPPLKPLLKSVAAIDALITNPLSTAYHDYWSFPLSLPLYFGTTLNTIPGGIPYISAEPARMAHWGERLPTAGMKVGLVWQGNPQHSNDINRSVPDLSMLAPLWDVQGITYVSLQKNNAVTNTASSLLPLVDLGNDLQDFADTAAVVAQLDLVICVDTAVAHLAGAMGKPCWVLLARRADWRWLLERNDSPWYPGTMRLFRQSVYGDWSEPVNAIAQALNLRVKAI